MFLSCLVSFIKELFSGCFMSRFTRTEPLSHSEMEALKEEKGYRPILELRNRAVPTGVRLEVLDSYGGVTYYTLKGWKDPGLGDLHAVARMESGHHKGMSFQLDTSLTDWYDAGWKLIENFPDDMD